MTDSDRKLINYLAKHKHMSPFRHVQFSFILEDVPEFILRQVYKHQVGIGYSAGEFKEVATIWNEVSGRYVKFERKFFMPDKFRKQHKSNKQASQRDELVDRNDVALDIYVKSMNSSWDAYEDLLAAGVCREQARWVLPLGFTSSVYWTASLEALAHFVRLRFHEGAQVEIQEMARIIQDIIQCVCPISTNALLSVTN